MRKRGAYSEDEAIGIPDRKAVERGGFKGELSFELEIGVAGICGLRVYFQEMKTG